MTLEAGNTYSYDAWNRLVDINLGYASTSYMYDAKGEQITISLSGQDIYYDAAGQSVEEHFSTSYIILQNVWSIDYVNDMVLRDDGYTGAGNLGVTGGNLSRRLYVHQDADWDAISLSDMSGAVVNWTFYTDPFGTENSFGGAYLYAYGFQGGRHEFGGLIHFGARDYDTNGPSGHWMQQEPFGASYTDGANLYQFEGGNTVNRADPSGFAVLPPPPAIVMPAAPVTVAAPEIAVGIGDAGLGVSSAAEATTVITGTEGAAAASGGLGAGILVGGPLAIAAAMQYAIYANDPDPDNFASQSMMTAAGPQGAEFIGMNYERLQKEYNLKHPHGPNYYPPIDLATKVREQALAAASKKPCPTTQPGPTTQPDLGKKGTLRNPDGSAKSAEDQLRQVQERQAQLRRQGKGESINDISKSEQRVKNSHRMNKPYDPNDYLD